MWIFTWLLCVGWDLDADARRDRAHGFLEIQAGLFHEKSEDIAFLTTPKAVIKSFGRHYVKRWRALAVEGTRCLVVLTRAFELDMFADDFDDVGARPHFLYDMLRNHRSSATVTPVPPSTSVPARKDLIRGSDFSVCATTARNAPVPLPCTMRSDGRSARIAASIAGVNSAIASSARLPIRFTSLDALRSLSFQGRTCTAGFVLDLS